MRELKPDERRKWIRGKDEREAISYKGMVHLAHEEGLRRITTKLLQAPSDENGRLAICWAEVETSKGTFCGIGDACPENVGRMIVLHICRMAETRAKARAMRDALDSDYLAIEELDGQFRGGEDEEDDGPPRRFDQPGSSSPAAPPQRPPLAFARPPADAPAPRGGSATSDGHGADRREGAITPVQVDRLIKLRAALGRPAQDDSGLTQEQAAAAVKELVAIFNAGTKVRP